MSRLGPISVAPLLAALVLAAPAPAAGATAMRCDTQAAKITYRARAMLRHFAGMVYPADVEYLLLRNSFRRFRQAHCPQAVLGRALRRDLSPRARSRLLALLPTAMARAFRRALDA